MSDMDRAIADGRVRVMPLHDDRTIEEKLDVTEGELISTQTDLGRARERAMVVLRINGYEWHEIQNILLVDERYIRDVQERWDRWGIDLTDLYSEVMEGKIKIGKWQ